LARTLRNPTLSAAIDYIDKLEVQLVTAEGNLLILESRGVQKPIAEIIHDFTSPKPKKIESQDVRRLQNPPIKKSDLPAEIQHLGDKVLDAFITLVRESHDWGGEPSVGGSEAGPSLRGALPHLKRAGLLTTYVKKDASSRGEGTYVQFTPLGKRMAESIDDILDMLDFLRGLE
jgi:hypothetical protein